MAFQKDKRTFRKNPHVSNAQLLGHRRRLLVRSAVGTLSEVDNGNLDELTSQEASVRIMADEFGNRYIIKLARKGKGYNHLLQQAHRIQRLKAAGIDIVPDLIDVSIKKSQVYYIMPFVEGVSGYKAFFGKAMRDSKFLSRFNNLISQLNTRLWAKGKTSTEEKHFTKRQEYVVDRGIRTIGTVVSGRLRLENNLLFLNGEEVPSLGELLIRIKGSSVKIDKILSTCKIPGSTHGDLHFDNILIDPNNNIMLFDVNGNPEREKSIIEFEIGRLFMSFYREIIAQKYYNTSFDENGTIRANISLKGEDILRKRQLAYEMIFSHPEMSSWFMDKEKSKKIAQFMEALHLVTVFASRPEGEKIATYLFGTKLLADALKQMNIEN
jgi:hypothetical protein